MNNLWFLLTHTSYCNILGNKFQINQDITDLCICMTYQFNHGQVNDKLQYVDSNSICNISIFLMAKE